MEQTTIENNFSKKGENQDLVKNEEGIKRRSSYQLGLMLLLGNTLVMFKKLKSRPLKFQFKENVRSHHLGVLYEQRSKGWETKKTSCQQSLHYNIQRKAVVEVGSSNKFVCDKIIEEAFVLEVDINVNELSMLKTVMEPTTPETIGEIFDEKRAR